MIENIQIILLISVFVIMSVLMFLRKMPALMALPFMAILIAFIGGINSDGVLRYVIGFGTLKLHSAYTVAMFGSMLSILLQKTGIAENIIKKGAELTGDNPFIIAFIMLLMITLLFTTIGGLGAIIMVATIVLPIMSSVGLSPLTTVGIFLIGLSAGGTLNAGNWAVYTSVMGLKISQILPFASLMFFLTLFASVIFITIQLYRDGQEINPLRYLITFFLVLTPFISLFVIYKYLLPLNVVEVVDQIFTMTGNIIGFVSRTIVILLFIYALIKPFIIQYLKKTHDPVSYLAPIYPLLLILLFEMDFIAAFVAGLLFVFLLTYRKGSLNLLIQSIFEGGSIVMPAVVLMFGIGMLLVAIMGPGTPLSEYPGGWPVLGLLKPVLANIVPQTKLTYILIFAFLAPLALYRGPFNVWGMGYGLAAVFLASGLAPGAVMGLLLSVGQIQGISDPTNTHNVWLANEMRVDVQKILWTTLPYTWILAVIGLIIAAIMFM